MRIMHVCYFVEYGFTQRPINLNQIETTILTHTASITMPLGSCQEIYHFLITSDVGPFVRDHYFLIFIFLYLVIHIIRVISNFLDTFFQNFPLLVH